MKKMVAIQRKGMRTLAYLKSRGLFGPSMQLCPDTSADNHRVLLDICSMLLCDLGLHPLEGIGSRPVCVTDKEVSYTLVFLTAPFQEVD